MPEKFSHLGTDLSSTTLAVINTGGTISCVGNPLAPMSAAEFALACQTQIDPIVESQYPGLSIDYLTSITFPESQTGTLDSTNLQPSDWCIMAGSILSNYAKYDGWIILHGTDSMDFTGTALPFLLSSFNSSGIGTAVLSKPVILTGSQMPLFYQVEGTQLTLNFNTDAFQNFCGSIAAALTGIPEVCIYFQNHLYRSNRAVKTNASEFNAFSSPNYPILGEYGVEFTVDAGSVLPGPVNAGVSLDDPSVLSAAIAQLTYIQANIDAFPVMQFNAFPAAYAMSPAGGVIAALIKVCVGQGIKGLILESYGEGNFPSGNPDNPSQGAAYQALAAANQAGVVLVDCTQVLSGVVNDSAYAAGAWLPQVGALNPSDMTPVAALAKLMILLTAAGYEANAWTTPEVETLLQLNLLGEMSNVSRLDSRSNSLLLPGQSLSTLDGSAALVNDQNLGPVLYIQDSQVWTAIQPAPPASGMPGLLVMQDDGKLVFYSRSRSPLWSTSTRAANPGSSMLMLKGAGAVGELEVVVYDYSNNVVSATLYP